MLATIDPVAIRLGPLSIHWYGLIIAAAIVLAYHLILREGKRQGFQEEFLTDGIFWMILWGFVGARLYYVIFQWDYYQEHPEQILQVWNGGLAVYGGILAGAITLLVLARKNRWSLPLLLDVTAPGVLIAQAIGRWGNFMNQEAHGGVVSRTFLEELHLPNFLIDQMQIKGNYYHPTFLYESLWNILGFVLLLVLRRQPRLLRQGEIAAGYFIWYGLGRFVIEGMRTDSLYLGSLRVSQWLSVVLVLGSLVFVVRRRRQQPAVPFYREADEHKRVIKEI